MAVNPAIAASGLTSRTDSTFDARMYELTSAQPLPQLEIPVTLTLLAFGSKANRALIKTYSAHRLFLTRLSNTARLIAVTSWLFLPLTISHALVFPMLLCALPKLFTTMLLLSAPLLRMLMTQYEFWFTTILNFLGMILFAIQIGPDIRLGYPFLTFMSIQVTICSDADVYTLSETARAGVLSSVCATALGLFALHRSVYFKTLPPSSSRDWNLAQVNFMANVSTTLAIFIINKSYKRRFVFPERAQPFVPLAVCRAKLTVKSKRITKAPTITESTGRRSNVSASSEHDVPVVFKSAASADRRKSSVVLAPGKMLDFRTVPLARHVVDANNTLVPQFCLQRRISPPQYALLTLCGAAGLGFAMASMLLIMAAGNYSRSLLNTCGGVSMVATSVYCLFYAAHYQRDMLFLLLKTFDFWFTSFQFVAATICLADLLGWDFRCLNLIPWLLWFLWSLLTDALLPTYKRKLRFRKCLATAAMIAIIAVVILLAYELVFKDGRNLQSRIIDIGTLRGFFTIVISTGTFMGYRLATIMLWTCRLAWRLGFRPEGELVLLRSAIEFKNPFYKPAYDGGSQPGSLVPEKRHAGVEGSSS